MVTMGHMVEFEHEVPKLKKITDKIVTMSAGDALVGSKLARAIDSEFPNVAPSVHAVAEASSKIYVRLRDEKVETDIFRPRGITRQQFYEKGCALPQQAAFAIDQEVMRVNLGVEVIIAGVDDAGGHLYYVGNPGGTAHELGQVGFHAIGSGGIHALQSLIGSAHCGSHSVADTIFAVYSAKRRAEAAPGVGKDTDVAIIGPHGYRQLSTKDMSILSELYAEFSRPIIADMKDKLAKLSVLDGKDK